MLTNIITIAMKGSKYMEIWQEDLVSRCTDKRYIIGEGNTKHFSKKWLTYDTKFSEVTLQHNGIFTITLRNDFFPNDDGHLEIEYSFLSDLFLGVSLVSTKSKESPDGGIVTSVINKTLYNDVVVELSPGEKKFLIIHLGKWLDCTVKLEDILSNLESIH